MKRITLLLLTFSFIVNASEHTINIVDIKEVQHAISYESSEANNNSIYVSVISFIDEWYLDIEPDPIPARVESI